MGTRMNFGVIIRLLAFAAILFGFGLKAAAQDDQQSNLLTRHVKLCDPGKPTPYQLKDSYSILFDNATQTAKLKDFRVIFYSLNGQTLAETQTETHPLSGNFETYRLNEPAIGFCEIGLSVLSLHSGQIDDFPANVGPIVGMSEIEVLEPEDPKGANGNSVILPPSIPTLTAAEKQRLEKTASDISALLSGLDEKTETFAAAKQSRAQDEQRLDQLIADTAALLGRTDSPALPNLKPQINALNTDMVNAKADASLTDEQTELSAIDPQIFDLQSQIEALQTLDETAGADISTVMSSLTDIDAGREVLDVSLANITVPDAVTSAQLNAWNTSYLALKTQIEIPPSPQVNWPILLAGIIAGLAVLGMGAKALLSGKPNHRPLKSGLSRAEAPGVIFPASPMLAGNVAAPLAPAGQLAAAQLQMLSGPYAVLQDAYQATGRIGYAQEGVPSAEDYGFGTGFLVSDRHVVTNRHVHGLYGHYLLDETDPGGIEFIAEKGKDASDFVPFNCEPPLLLPALDIAIYTLARPVKTRKPLSLTPIEMEDLDGREIVVIGYPDTHTPQRPDILAVVEENPIFAVKRLSQGHIFRHSTDTDTPYGVETPVSESKHANFIMPAICHNASTLSGNSGSPLLDVNTGHLLGVHFAGFKVFNREEAANLAMAIAQLTDETSQKYLSAVTNVTGAPTKST